MVPRPFQEAAGGESENGVPGTGFDKTAVRKEEFGRLGQLFEDGIAPRLGQLVSARQRRGAGISQ